MNYEFLKVLHQYVPHRDDVADAAGKHKEVEDGVHVTALVQTIEDGSRNVCYTLGYNPDDGSCGHGIYQRFEGYQHRETHADETEGLDIGMLLQPYKAHNGSGNGTEPYE